MEKARDELTLDPARKVGTAISDKTTVWWSVRLCIGAYMPQAGKTCVGLYVECDRFAESGGSQKRATVFLCQREDGACDPKET